MKPDIKNYLAKQRIDEDKGLVLLEKMIPILEKYFHIRIHFNSSYYWEGTEKKPFLGLEYHRDQVEITGDNGNTALKKKDRAFLDELLLKHGIYSVSGWRGSLRFYDEEELKKIIHQVIENTKQGIQRDENNLINLKKKLALIKANPDLFDTRDRNEVFEEIERTKHSIISDHKELKRINRILSKSEDNLLKLMAILD